MVGFLIFLFFLFVGCIVGIVFGVKKLNAQKKKASDLGARDYVLATYIDGLGIAQNTPCELYLFDDRILIDTKQQKFEIKLNKIRAAVVKSERELIEKGKSVVGRALIGTVLVPGLGTIVGGMSGIGTKKKKGALNHFLILNYTDSQGELAAVTFLNNINLIKMDRFCNGINKVVSQTSEGEAVQL
jgi:hypothetical protein